MNMKRLMAWVLSLALLMCCAPVFAQEETLTFEQLSALNWEFCSGAGAWSTDMKINEDGTFTGDYHDSDMGDAGDDYPNGTVYCCSFSGTLSILQQVDEHSWMVRVDSLTLNEEPGQETIEDGFRYITAEAYGLTEGDEMRLYLPGTPVEEFTDEMQMWAHLFDVEEMPVEMDNWFLWSEANETGFVGYEYSPWPGMANPWETVTAEQLAEETGFTFGVPEGAEDVVYRFLREEALAEVQFTWEGCEFCARIQPAALEDGQMMNISGMYFEWEDEEEVTVGPCQGTIGQVKTGSTEWVQLCQWYDAAPGLMYSLSMYTDHDPDGLDLVAIAEQIYQPVQGDN